MDLAKVVVAAAWADGKLDNSEINSLKDLLFTLPRLSGDEWSELEIYIEAPVGRKEADRLLEDLIGGIRSEEEKELVVDTLKQLANADGEVNEAEHKRLKQVEEAVGAKNTSFFNFVKEIALNSMTRRKSAANEAPNREERIDDFVRNRIYFRLINEMEGTERALEIPEERARKFCLAAGLMAHIAWVDADISDDERNAISRVLHTDWGLKAEEAKLVAQISCEAIVKRLDRYRLCRGFFEMTGRSEREKFIKCLFQIANSSDKTTNEEIEEIRTIARLLKVPPGKFIEAKLTIRRGERRGL